MGRIDTTLEVLVVMLTRQAQAITNKAELAETAISNGHRNQAIGCLLECEHDINQIKATFDTLLTLHRTSLG